MTTDIVVLARREPSTEIVVRALLAAGPDLRLGSIGGAALQVFDEARTLVATVEAPSYIQVPGEAARLLGVTDAPDPPYWWIELRCPTLRPDATDIALRLAGSLAEQLDAVVWQTGSLL